MKKLFSRKTVVHKEIEEEIKKEIPLSYKHKKSRFVRFITSSGDYCSTCGRPLNKNNPKQIKHYCSEFCRKARHNKKSKAVKNFLSRNLTDKQLDKMIEAGSVLNRKTEEIKNKVQK